MSSPLIQQKQSAAYRFKGNTLEQGFFFWPNAKKKLRKGQWTSLLSTQFISQLIHCADAYTHLFTHDLYSSPSPALLCTFFVCRASPDVLQHTFYSALLCRYLCGFPSRSDCSATILKQPNSAQLHYEQTLSNLFTFVKFAQLCASSVAHLLVRIFLFFPSKLFSYFLCSISIVGGGGGWKLIRNVVTAQRFKDVKPLFVNFPILNSR